MKRNSLISSRHTIQEELKAVGSCIQYFRDDVTVRAIRSAGISFPICETFLKNETSKTNSFLSGDKYVVLLRPG